MKYRKNGSQSKDLQIKKIIKNIRLTNMNKTEIPKNLEQNNKVTN